MGKKKDYESSDSWDESDTSDDSDYELDLSSDDTIYSPDEKKLYKPSYSSDEDDEDDSPFVKKPNKITNLSPFSSDDEKSPFVKKRNKKAAALSPFSSDEKKKEYFSSSSDEEDEKDEEDEEEEDENSDEEDENSDEEDDESLPKSPLKGKWRRNDKKKRISSSLESEEDDDEDEEEEILKRKIASINLSPAKKNPIAPPFSTDEIPFFTKWEIDHGKVIHIGRGRENTHIVPEKGEYEPNKLVPGYDKKIIDEFFNQEQKFEGFMDDHQFINGAMFYILCDWLYEVSKKFKQVPECYFIAVRLATKYLYKIKTVRRSRLQLVGLTALFIADKYESIYPSDLSDYKFVCDNAYSLKEILDFEIELLTVLNFDISAPTVINFISHFVTNFDDLPAPIIRKICLYSTISTIYSDMEKYYPSMIAAASIYMDICNTQGKEWDDKMTSVTRYSKDELQECIKDLTNFSSKELEKPVKSAVLRLTRV